MISRPFRHCGWLHSLAGRALAAILALSLLVPVAEAKRYGSGGRKSFSSGSRSPSSSGKSGGYSSGRSSYSSGSSAGRSSGSGTSRSGYDAAAARARQQAESRSRFNSSKPPPIPDAAPHRSSSGNNGGGAFRGQAVPPPIPSTSSGRGYASSSQSGGQAGGSWNSRPWRRPSYAGGGTGSGARAALIGAAVLTPALIAYASRPVAPYQDPYGSPFWYWLLDQPQEVRASWLHHHQGDIDPARRAELLRADPALQEKVEALNARNVPVQPDYTPEGLKKEDMFADPAADALAAEAEAEEQRREARAASSRSGSGGLFWLVTLAAGAAMVWLIFVKRWQPVRHAA